jgi:hypothetical protein
MSLGNHCSTVICIDVREQARSNKLQDVTNDSMRTFIRDVLAAIEAEAAQAMNVSNRVQRFISDLVYVAEVQISQPWQVKKAPARMYSSIKVDEDGIHNEIKLAVLQLPRSSAHYLCIYGRR